MRVISNIGVVYMPQYSTAGGGGDISVNVRIPMLPRNL